MGVEIIVPVASMIMIGAVLSLLIYFRFRTRQDIQTTVQTAIKQGQELTPEVLERLSDALHSKHSDLRRGIISMAVGGAFAVFAILVDEDEAVGPLLGLSAFPFLIGLGYLGLWFFISRKRD